MGIPKRRCYAINGKILVPLFGVVFFLLAGTMAGISYGFAPVSIVVACLLCVGTLAGFMVWESAEKKSSVQLLASLLVFVLIAFVLEVMFGSYGGLK